MICLPLRIPKSLPRLWEFLLLRLKTLSKPLNYWNFFLKVNSTIVEFSLGNYSLRLFCRALFCFFVLLFTSFPYSICFSLTNFRLFLILNSTAFLLWNLLWEFSKIPNKKPYVTKSIPYVVVFDISCEYQVTEIGIIWLMNIWDAVDKTI